MTEREQDIGQNQGQHVETNILHIEIPILRNILSSKIHLESCMEGHIADHGYGLWVHSRILQDRGIPLEEIGTSQSEVRKYLVEDLRGRIQEIKDGTSETEEAEWDLIIIRAYFLKTFPDMEPCFPIPPEELGLNSGDLEKMEKDLDVISAKEELERCRQEEPSSRFWLLKGNLITNRVSLEEIDATQEEIEKNTVIYQAKHPYSNWDHYRNFLDKK